MYKFTEKAEKVIKLSKNAAKELGHNYVGTEHFLVGLMEEDTGVAYKVLFLQGLTKGSIMEKIEDLICFYNAYEPKKDNYMSKNFANTFFSLADCRKIGFIREDIEKSYIDKRINARERAILITSLLYAMDKIANTCGHYDAYIKGHKIP